MPSPTTGTLAPDRFVARSEDTLPGVEVLAWRRLHDRSYRGAVLLVAATAFTTPVSLLALPS
ncbi:hypothetical protein [Streptomyces sp. SBT349]|uniref:hypothetical protein n=1 Tax=Streptomyces sp. SBT349 TaxID=1580539 RepID=UPI00069DD22E|nr:hypothetical protein [Streptomyces sp. SBT349]